ncbi:uncharacterized protein MYCGRDRAFT_87981 [Zymoseptoria tritici IPO323]|uniref:Uncharacterized protein n=1 Tax=Zymoseptoria tritici (strain CBS 115943 / IPO323) TaxID=336722 RepID=F9XMT8_ZYMTI|nr:uncharacterized protein MYCGRDRAFT_87981 [Zymoseptoria tritici IPO323]EGP83299.1 hypothetical protein MYCGRDRAFT_87981 [Zymoseptoria tritici IPO323]
MNNGNFLRQTHAEAPPQEEDNPLLFEESRKKAGVSTEENRDMISSQHHQVKKSWENPGVYAWGSNTGRVAAPGSTDNVVKTPRRIPFFDGKLLRDIKLDRNFAAAIDENGDLLQWGVAYAPDTKEPVSTLKGKNLTSLVLSKDRILALGNNGTVYSIPVSADEQQSGTKPSEASWVPFWSGSRRVFSTASASDSFPSRGQLGVPGLTWNTRPAGSFDQPHEISTLRGFPVKKIACGDYHSLALDAEGRVFTWGDNASGQLGFDYNADSSIVDAPSLLATGPDTFAFGSGITGSLANNRWTHVQSTPTRIPALSGLFEYDEVNNTSVPIRLAHLSVGSTHAAAVMANITKVDVQSTGSGGHTDDDTNWGADVVFWGGNEHYQLGTGRRNNLNNPTYLQPLDREAEVVRAKKSSGAKEEHRFHVTPRSTVRLGEGGKGRKVSVEQRVECGRGVTSVYSGT